MLRDPQRLLGLIKNKVNKITGYKIGTKKSTVFLPYTRKNNPKKIVSFTKHQKVTIVEINRSAKEIHKTLENNAKRNQKKE